MKLFIAISMIFLVISCSGEENTILQDQISDYELKITELSLILFLHLNLSPT
jgi:hypothetical protein